MKAILYAAKSTEDTHGSIPDQLADGRRLAAQRGLEVVRELHDEAASAYHGNRGPGLAAAMTECERLSKEDGSCTLIVQHSDRLARGDGEQARSLSQVVGWAIANRVTIVSKQDPEMFPSNELREVLAAIGGFRNHQDSKRKSLAVKDGMRRRANRGKPNGGPRPYGYRRVGDNLLVIPAEAEVVRRIYEQTIAGASQRSLSRSLNVEGIPTISGKPWAQSMVAKVLTNPLYRGSFRHAGEEHPGEHEAIVSEDTWQRAATLRANAARRAGGRRPRGSHLLGRGLLKCSCGYTMVARTSGDYEVYECRGRLEHGRDFCPQGVLRREVVDQAMLDELTNRWIDLDASRRQIEDRHNSDLVMARSTAEDAEREVLRKQEAMARVERDYLDGGLPAADWVRFRTSLAEELAAAESALERAQAHVAALEQAGPLGDADLAVLERLAALKRSVAEGVENAPDLDALRMTIRTLFKSVLLLTGSDALLRSGPPVEPGGICLLPRPHKAVFWDFEKRRMPDLPVLPQTDHDSLGR